MKPRSGSSLYPSGLSLQNTSTVLKPVPLTAVLMLALLGLFNYSLAAATTPEPSVTSNTAPVDVLPTLADGVAALEFQDFFKLPIGPLGLEPTAKLLSLDQQRVRIVGYMVEEEEPLTGRFMLTAAPVRLAETADGPADDLPASILFVQMPAGDAGKTIDFRPGRWILTGTLQLGQREEADGRIAYATLLVEPDGSAAEPVKAASVSAEQEQLPQ